MPAPLHFALPTDTRKDSEDSNSGFWDALPYVAVGGGGCGKKAEAQEGGAAQVVGAASPPPLPLGLLAMGLPALGFTATGIAANSWASWLMSWSAVANGGGVPAGGLVATLQSLGESGPPEQRHPCHIAPCFTVLSPFHKPTRLPEEGILINPTTQWVN